MFKGIEQQQNKGTLRENGDSEVGKNIFKLSILTECSFIGKYDNKNDRMKSFNLIV